MFEAGRTNHRAVPFLGLPVFTRTLKGWPIFALVLALLANCELPFSNKKKEDTSGFALLALLGASASSSTVPCESLTASPASGTALATTVISATANANTSHKNPLCATNGVRGGGSNQGSGDVFSMSATGSGAVMVLAFTGVKITNGAGTDFVVYENPFNINANPSDRFMEQIVVEVSYDGSNWCGFNPAYSSATYSTNPGNWVRFGGTNPVLYNQDTNDMSSATLFSSGGGDSFDLANLATGTTTGANCSAVAANAGCTAGTITTLQGSAGSQGVRYVRLIAASACTNPNAGGSTFPQDTGAFDGPDIDGIIGRYPASLP